MSDDTETMVAAIKQVETRLLETVRARQEAALADEMAKAVAIQKLADDAHSALQSALKDRNYIATTQIIEPLLKAVHGVLATAPDEAPRAVIPDNAVIDDVPALDTSEDAEPVKRNRRLTPAARPLAPRLICREDAAAYASVSPNTFDKMVVDGLMPDPLRLTGRRLAWDVRQLDAAIDRLPVDGDAESDTETTDHSWDDIDAQAKTKPAVR